MKIFKSVAAILITLLVIGSSMNSVYAADTALTDMTADATPSDDDLVYSLNDPSGTPGDRKVTWSNMWVYILGKIGATNLGDISADSLTYAKSDGVAGDTGWYEANSTDTDTAGNRGPDTLDYSYRLKMPDTRVSSANMVRACTNVGESGDGGETTPYVQDCDWADLDDYLQAGDLAGIDSIDATGAVDMDYGSADVTDHTFTTDGGTVVLDGTIVASGTIESSGAFDVTGSAGLDIGSADVTDITLLGQSEDLALTPSANTWTLSSSTGVTEIDFSGFQMVTTGAIMGGVNISSKTAATYTVGTDDANESYGTLFVNGDDDAIDFTLPSAVAGMSACFMQGQGVSSAITVQPNTGDYLVVDGTRGTAATDYASTGAGGDKICVVAMDATDWIVTTEQGTWSE
jgi:hypothetical protein